MTDGWQPSPRVSGIGYATAANSTTFIFTDDQGETPGDFRTPSGPDYPTKPEYDPDDPPPGEPVEDDPGTDHEPVTEET